jgi:hypothetical protein
LTSLEKYAGTYTSPSDRLVVEIRSLGYSRGLEVIWRWAGGGVDLGLIGTTGDASLALSLLGNSQPWWGTAFLRTFRQDDVAADPSRHRFAFKWVADDKAGPAHAERIAFTFTMDEALIYEFEVEGESPLPLSKQWRLQRTSASVSLEVTVSPALHHELETLDEDLHATEGDALAKAVALLRLAVDARKQGKRVAILDEDLAEVDREITGI